MVRYHCTHSTLCLFLKESRPANASKIMLDESKFCMHLYMDKYVFTWINIFLGKIECNFTWMKIFLDESKNMLIHVKVHSIFFPPLKHQLFSPKLTSSFTEVDEPLDTTTESEGQQPRGLEKSTSCEDFATQTCFYSWRLSATQWRIGPTAMIHATTRLWTLQDSLEVGIRARVFRT